VRVHNVRTHLIALRSATVKRLRAEGDARRPLSAIAIVVLAALACYLAAPPAANADAGYAINGRYAATSDGTYATTNYAFHNQATVRSVWTITSTCRTDVSCVGQVTSDQGWSAPLSTEGHIWYVQRDLPTWETCPDGSTSSGHQTFMFYPTDTDGVNQIGSPHLEGRDKTLGARFGCGRTNLAEVTTVVMQFRLDRIT
jgi:hypothetical protein